MTDDVTCHCCDKTTDDPVSARWTAVEDFYLCPDCESNTEKVDCANPECFEFFYDVDPGLMLMPDGWMQDDEDGCWCSACWRARQPGE